MIQELRPEFGLAILLEVSGMARATFYYHIKRLQKVDKYAEIKEQRLYFLQYTTETSEKSSGYCSFAT